MQDDLAAAVSLSNSRPRAVQRDRKDMQGYVGSRGSNVFNRIFINTIDPVTGTRPFGSLLTTQIDRKSAMGKTKYDGMTLGLQRNMKDGLLVQGTYTLGDSRDNNAGNGEGSEWQNARCGDCEWGPSDFDVRHSMAMNVVYQLPFGDGPLFGGWDVSGVVMAKSGRPINVTTARTAPDGSDVNQRPNLVPGVEPVTGNLDRWLNAAAFAAPAANQFGNSPRNGFRGPSSWQFDLSLNKVIRISGRSSIDLRLDAFNLFNLDQYGNPARDFSAPLTFGVLSPLNSGPTGTGTARQFQLGVRLNF